MIKQKYICHRLKNLYLLKEGGMEKFASSETSFYIQQVAISAVDSAQEDQNVEETKEEKAKQNM